MDLEVMFARPIQVRWTQEEGLVLECDTCRHKLTEDFAHAQVICNRCMATVPLIHVLAILAEVEREIRELAALARAEMPPQAQPE